MPTKGLLRTLIVMEIVLGFTSVVVSFITEPMLPEPLRAFVNAESEEAITAYDMILLAFGIPLILLFLVSSIGLFLFWRPARILYVVTIVAGFVLTPIFGPYVDAGWGRIFEDAAVVVSGVILGLVYFTPLREMYDRPARATA
jgi:hypothetical protein